MLKEEISLVDMQDPNISRIFKDPVSFKKLFWPNSVLTDYQLEILQSVQKNKITVVPAGNKLGKDYVSAFCGLWFFCSRMPCKVVTTSVDSAQLNSVLWGEIRNFIQSAAIPLPVQVNHQQIRQILPDGTLKGNSEFVGRVVQKGEGMLGRHLPYGPNMEPRVLCIIDEASGFADSNYMGVDTWAHRILIIGNPFPCDNFFKKMVQQGDLKSESPYLDYDIKVLKIPATRSPNVRLALEEEKLGKPISRTILVPGCIDIDDYRFRAKTYDPVKKAAGLDAEFYEGEEVKMFPQTWLSASQERADGLEGQARTFRRTLGVDTAEGGDNTVWTVVDRLGVIEQVSMKTRNTAMIKGRTIALMKSHNIRDRDVLFDRGGGGKEHVDYLRQQGFMVNSVGFGENPTPPDEFMTGWKDPEEKKNIKEQRYAYKNKRAQLYGTLRELLNPDRVLFSENEENEIFAIPRKFTEIIRQLLPLPLLYDGEGRLYLPSKNKRTARSKETTIQDLLGHSPDETDSLVLAVFALVFVSTDIEIGAL